MILVVASHSKGKLTKSTFELVSAARQLNAGMPIAIAVLGHGAEVDPIAAQAAALADQVLVANQPELAGFNPEVWSQAASFIAAEGECRLVLIPGSRSGRAYSPRVAVRLDAPLLEDVVTLSLNGDEIEAQRYSYLARVTETVAATSPIAVVTVKPGAFAPAAPLPAPGEQFELEAPVTASRVQTFEERAEAASKVLLQEAEIVVAGGRGVGDAQGFESSVVRLAEALGAAVGATRAVVDAGWRPYTEQVGQTGKTVQPKVYIAVGISGATQHLSGMNKSKVVVAINKDGDAPIFRIADYGLVGDVNEIVPALLKRLQQTPA